MIGRIAEAILVQLGVRMADRLTVRVERDEAGRAGRRVEL